MPDTARSEPLLQRIAWLEAQTARLEAASAIKRLQRAFGYYLDAAQSDEAAALFADDATIEMGLDGIYCGRERIRQYLRALGGGRSGLRHGEIHEWFQLQPVIHVAPDGLTAKARWRTFLIAGQLGEQAVWGEGPYEVEYVRHAGVWKIGKLHWYQTLIVPYEGGWLRNKDVTGGVFISRQLPPDHPPSESYDTWPGVYIPPFHYESPVTAFPAPQFELESARASGAARPPQETTAAQSLGRSMEALERRLRRLHDIAQIENLISAYGYDLDKQRWDALASLFAEDATMEISQRGTYVGRASIRRALELFGPQGVQRDHLHNHQQLQPVIHVSPDGKRAWARSRAFGQLGVYQGGGLWHGGVYENEFVQEGGVWKFKTDHVYTTYFALYDQGWMSGARPTAKMSEKIPPDGPPSVVYESFPEIYVPPFHYGNPATGHSNSAPGAAGHANNAGIATAALTPELRGIADRISKAGGRVERLEDEQAIENLQRSYGYYVDKALWKETADLFTDDGTLEIGGRGVFTGKERVLEYLEWLEPKGLTRGKLFDHMQLQPLVTVSPDGKSARGRLRFFAQVGEYQKSALWGLGTYENDYVKESGVWKIRTLHSYFRMYTPYSDGWGKTGLPNTRPEKTLPPDRPPTVVYDQYPSPYVPAYHFANPVTGTLSGARAASGSDQD